MSQIKRKILKQESNFCCQIDLIDFQSQPDKEYKIIQLYQDDLIKFGIRKAKVAKEVAHNL